MKIEMLMSSCRIKKISELKLKEKNIDNAIIVNQFVERERVDKDGNYVMYSYNEKGIAKSRNRLLEKMTGDIEIITDDDIEFVANYKDIIKKAYSENDADIIIFNMKKGNIIVGHDKMFKYNKISTMSVCSCQITFRTNSIRNNNLKFNELFGIGSKFISGEENIFLKDALNKGLKIIHIPTVINSHPEEDTTGESWNDNVIISKGALMYELYKSLYFIFLLYFVIFKHKNYKKNYSFIKFAKLFINGKKTYKKIKK